MTTTGSRLPGVSRYRAAVGAVALALLAAILAVSREPITPDVGAVFALAIGYFVLVPFDRVREHPLFDVARAAWLVLVFGLWYVVGEDSGVVLAAFVVLALVGLAVEIYNYRHGTSYLRFEW